MPHLLHRSSHRIGSLIFVFAYAIVGCRQDRSGFSEGVLEIEFKFHTHALSGHCAAHIIILVVEVIICLESQGAPSVEQILYIEITYEIAVAGVHAIVAITEVTIEYQSIVEQLTRKCQVHFHIGEVALIASEIRRYASVFTQLAKHIRELRREC